ncbi:deoxyguanosinetriphosphate triphosphohydrolase [uncultured Gemmiger sp.]|uniref:deoxyguanosinetriphosphate triphosphohydrolase n=1 Tax=uncultured Gemmiger sp. TaxID=1623490 RepID=UPI0025CD0E06|nr:deoxyguanosinetriphosphate triphosphohydrolase [uncultured Gemmiger sp.]
MTVREQTQTIERLTLSRYATLSENSRGRTRPEPEDPLRPCYQRDRDRILHCKAFRRLKQKTQVFLSPEGDHYRTRLTHTLEVSQIARTIARALRLNEDLTEAIALGHDLGHTPFGHAGERALNRLCPGGFTHYQQSLRVVEYLEKDGKGLNLTWEVRNGIVTHTTGEWARTLEGCTVRYADHIAFLNHDIEDAITAGVLSNSALPPDAVRILGSTKSQRITTMITDLVENSSAGEMHFSPDVEDAYHLLKDFMYSTVYVDKQAKREEKKVDKVVEELYARLCDNPSLMPNFYMQIAYKEGIDRAVVDYISGMSDHFAIRLFEDLFVPQKWQVL